VSAELSACQIKTVFKQPIAIFQRHLITKHTTSKKSEKHPQKQKESSILALYKKIILLTYLIDKKIHTYIF